MESDGEFLGFHSRRFCLSELQKGAAFKMHLLKKWKCESLMPGFRDRSWATSFVSLSVLKGRKRVGDKKLAWINFQAIVQETELEGGAGQGQGGRGALNYLLSSGGSRHQVG